MQTYIVYYSLLYTFAFCKLQQIMMNI